MQKVDGKYVLVTGASAGIGQAIAGRFAQEGAHVAINYRSGAEQAEVTRAMVRDAYTSTGRPDRRELVVQADVANEDRVKAMFTRVLAEFGRLDVLINNAGIQKVGPAMKSKYRTSTVFGTSTCAVPCCARTKPSGIFSRGRVEA